MRVLTIDEADQVDGGVGAIGAALGAIGAAVGAYQNNASAGTIVAAGLLGAVAGFFGDIAATPGIGAGTAAMFGAYSISVAATAGLFTMSVTVGDIQLYQEDYAR